MDIKDLTIEKAHEGLKKKEFSCKELTESCVKKAEQVNDDLNIFITLNKDNALKKAGEVDAKIGKGEQIGILEGIPAGIKDIFNTRDVRTTNASKITENMIPPYDATVVSKLKDAGLVMVGKTNCDEFACGASNEYSAFGPCKHPQFPEYVPGGSSGGSAAALAADTCLYSLGTDTGGSIRQPASFCGLAGLKVTYGRVSRSGVTSLASSLDTIGSFGKNVRDIAHILQVIAGADVMDSTTPPNEVPDYIAALSGNIKGLKIGIPKEYFSDEVDHEVKEHVMNAVKLLEKNGAEVKEIELPMNKYAVAVYYIILPAEFSANLARFDGIRYGRKPEEEGKGLVDYYYHARGEGFGPEIKRRLMIGTYVLSAGYYDAYYKKAQKVRTLIKKEFEDVFKEVDVLIGPTSPFTAFKIGEKVDDPLQMYLADILTCPINIAGVPSLNVPCGETKDGFPIGMQIIGPQFSEDLIMRVGDAYEQMKK